MSNAVSRPFFICAAAVLLLALALAAPGQADEQEAAPHSEAVTPWTETVSPEDWSFPVVIDGGDTAAPQGAYRHEFRLLAPEHLNLELPLGPFGITRIDQELWVGLVYGRRLLRIDLAAGTATAYPLPGEITPFLLTPDPGGGIWFTDFDEVAPGTGHVLHLEPSSGLLTGYTIPVEDAGPADLAFAADGRLWFSNFRGASVGALTIDRTGQGPGDAQLTLYPTPARENDALVAPFGLIADEEQGTVWYAEAFEPRIYELNPETAEQRGLALPQGFRSIVGLAQGPEGNLWTGQHGGNRLVEITPDGGTVRTIITAAPPRGPSAINDLAFGPDGHLWFSQHFVNRIGRFDPAGATETVMEYTVGDEPLIQWLVTGDQAVWFAAYGEDTLVRMDAAAAPVLEVRLQGAPESTAAGETLEFDVFAAWQGEPPANTELAALVQTPTGLELVDAQAQEPPEGYHAAFRIQVSVRDDMLPRTVAMPVGVSGGELLAVTGVELAVTERVDPTSWILPAALALLLAAGAMGSFILARRLLSDAA